MKNIFSEKKERKLYEHSNYFSLFIIYIVTVAIAAIIIVPTQESCITGIIKSAIWPLYSLTFLLK